jgi:ribonuclease-3
MSLQWVFTNPKLLERALRHPSYSEENNNKALETYGDRLLKLLQTRLICCKYKSITSAKLTRERQKIETNEVLHKYIPQFGLEQAVLVDASIRNDPIHLKRAYSRVFEAIVAAIYIDSGFNWKVLEDWFRSIA